MEVVCIVKIYFLNAEINWEAEDLLIICANPKSLWKYMNLVWEVVQVYYRLSDNIFFGTVW